MRDYIARAKGLVTKLDQDNISTTKKEINRRILNGLPSEFDVDFCIFLCACSVLTQLGACSKVYSRISRITGAIY